MLLPKFMVLKSKHNGKYLRFRHENGSTHEFVQCSGDEASSPYAKFEVVKASSDKDYVHLKCCYNNKYLTIYYDQNHKWIVARADKPVEDKINPMGTMFRPWPVKEDPRAVRFRHDKLGFYACRGPVDGRVITNCLYLTLDPMTTPFTYVDWETLVTPEPKDYNIEIGEWGGSEGDDWRFEVAGGITKMIIQYSKDVVAAVSFVGKSADGSETVESPLFGGDGGNKSEEIVLDWPNEYLMSISGTHGKSSCDSNVITSLEFVTNNGKKIGPFGKKKGTAFALKMKKGAIVGFHGRSSSVVDAIGIFTRHID